MQISDIQIILDRIKKEKFTGKIEISTNSGGLVGLSVYKKQELKKEEDSNK